MSYLNRLRLHFAGRFQAAPSTVNNDVTHYNNATFKPEYQERQQGPNHPNGWWNPRGDADWRLIGCAVTAAWHANGQAAGPTDPILQSLVADSDRLPPAKLVDLDPQQQLVSTIWGLEVRICDANGTTLLRGRFVPTGFMDIWDRAQGGGGDIGACATYQSVLTQLEWGDTSGSPFLQELRAAAHDDLLSIKFNVDGYNMNFRSPDFTRGRVVGTIGPATSAEPHHFVPGRQFMTTGLPQGNFFAPQGQINFCTAVVDQQAGKILVDLGNALPTTQPGGPPSNIGALSLAYTLPPDQSHPSGQTVTLGTVAYTDAGWYERTAGIVELPSGRALTPDELAAVADNQLALLLTGTDGTPALGILESPGGLYVRADQFVVRLNPDGRARVRLFATRFGQPYPGARILAVFDPSMLQGGPGQPPVAEPADALDFKRLAVANEHGVAQLTISGHDPQNPRGYIDGQLYGVRPLLEETLDYGVNYPTNPWNFISVLLWDAFQPDDPPTWYGSLQPIFQQYANLYPVMDRFLDLAGYDEVCANRELLLFAFGLEPADPNAMPVTRDLSPAKRQAILRWLSETGADGNPLLGTAPPVPASLAAVATAPAASEPPVDTLKGGKAAAAGRRLFLRSWLR